MVWPSTSRNADFLIAVRNSFLLFPCLFALAACSQGRLDQAYPASGLLAGETFTAKLDSPIARYYLEDYPDVHPDGWYEKIAEFESRLSDEGLSQALLGEVTRATDSVDLAALMFARHIRAGEGNRHWQACVTEASQGLRSADDLRDLLIFNAADNYKILFAPGWLYEDNAQTEADFARTRASLDHTPLEYHFVPTPQDGSVESNAEMLADAIRDYQGTDLNLIVVSASKSAAEVHWALGTLLTPEEGEAVVAWVNAGGVLGGTPLADQWTRFPRNLMARLVFLRYGWNWNSLHSLRTDRSRERLEKARLPENLPVINYVAVPMTTQVSEGARGRHRFLARYGPNDGLAPLMYTKVAGQISLVESGADHYFLTVDIGTRTLAMTEAVLAFLEGEDCGGGRLPRP